MSTKLRPESDQADIQAFVQQLILIGTYRHKPRFSVQGVKSLSGHFAYLCREFDFYEVKKKYYYFSKRKGKHFYTFNHFYSEKSSKKRKMYKSTTMTPNLPE